MKALTTTHSSAICNPDKCPIAENCPVGPMPGAPCEIKQMFLEEISSQMALSFKNIDDVPEVRLRVNVMLKPLFDQLLNLQMAQMANPEALFGTKANPLMKEIREVMKVINNILNETIRLYHQGPEDFLRSKKNGDGAAGQNMLDKGYYEMLIIDGQKSVEERKGIETD